jgi:hypothetical protein
MDYPKNIFCDDKLKLTCGDRKNNFHFVTINIYFFAEKNLSIISVANLWQQLATKFCQNSALSFIVKIVTMVRLRKVVIQHISLLGSIFWQHLATKFCQNSAHPNIRVKNATKNLVIVLGYGNIKKNVKILINQTSLLNYLL